MVLSKRFLQYGPLADAPRQTRLLIGCCGSGKSTVTSYALGTEFRYRQGGDKALQPQSTPEGMVMSDAFADATRGLWSAEVA